jgi:hypothetical protein
MRNHPSTTTPARRRARAGFTLLEAQISFVLLGIGLAGVGPLVVFQLKMSRKLQLGVNPQTGNYGTINVATLVPSSDPWMRKLGVASTITSTGGSPPSSGYTGPPSYDVTIVAPVAKSMTGETVTVYVSAVSHPTGSGSGP